MRALMARWDSSWVFWLMVVRLMWVSPAMGLSS